MNTKKLPMVIYRLKCKAKLMELDYLGGCSIEKAKEMLELEFPKEVVNEVVDDYLTNYNLFTWENKNAKVSRRSL